LRHSIGGLPLPSFHAQNSEEDIPFPFVHQE
jgi:hypothetical protein